MIYTHRPWKVAAVQWTGDNFDKIAEFAREYIGDPDEIGLRNEPWSETIGGRTFSSNAVQFYAWGDDQEVDPGWWIVVDVDTDDRNGSTMDEDDFRIAYQMAAVA